MHAKGMYRAGLGLALALAVSACSPNYRTHGFVPAEDDLQQIVPGVDTRSTVEDLVGVPSTSGLTRDSGFYYVESEVRQFGWTRPKVTDRTILAITFDNADVVENITSYGLEDGRVVPLSRRVTQVGDGDIGFIRKLFGNIGGLSVGDALN